MTTPPVSRYADLTHSQLAVLVPELLLIGHLIDRSGMAWCISAFGRDQMLQIAIDEWAGASPVYTKRMQRALGFAPEIPGQGDVVTIFKGLQLEIGAPPQFLDFRYTVHDPQHGAFHLDHCGALMDVEPMGEDYVQGMCHDIEDPTFDATAVASNPRAQVRPVHRPPRVPADRSPVCSWTVIIDDSYPEVSAVPAVAINAQTQAALLDLTPIDPTDEGVADYAGPLMADLDFASFSRSALIRIADEVCLQMALLDSSFVLALNTRAESEEQVLDIRHKQATGVSGMAAHRLVRALDLPKDEQGALQMLALHPFLNPSAYVTAEIGDHSVLVRRSPAHDDAAWISLCNSEWFAPLQAAVRVLDPHLDVELESMSDDEWSLTVVRRDEPAPEAQELTVAKFSTGAEFAFEGRRSLPLTPV